MKLGDLILVARGLSPREFSQRFGEAFLVEEGRLPHEPASSRMRSSTRRMSASASGQVESAPITDREVFSLKRRDGKPGDIVIGRGAQCDVRIDVESISTRHAIATAPVGAGGKWRVRDAVSTNGTFVDGEKLAIGREVVLANASVVRFGPEVRLAFYELASFMELVKTADASGKFADEGGGGDTEIGMEAAILGTRHDILGGRVPGYLAAERDVSSPVPKSREPTPEPAPAPPPPLHRPPSGKSPIKKIDVTLPADSPVILACDPFPPATLKPGKPATIGRDKSVELVLPNPQVSRRHAEVERVQVGVAVRDLGSQNGIFFEGQRVKSAVVPFGGTFQVGPYTIEVQTPGWTPPVIPGAAQGTMVVKAGAIQGLRGSFDEMPLTELLQGIEFNQKTGVIDVVTDDEHAGFVSFRGGTPHQARYGALHNEEAVLALLALRHGRFVLKSDEAAVGPRAMQSSFTALLLEHGRRTDEKKK